MGLYQLVRMQSLLEQNYIILDGGMGTELARLGYDTLYDDELWGARLLISKPDIVKQAHINFLHAGADIIETNTYQINVEFLKKVMGVTELEAIRVIQTGVSIARDAVEEYWKSLDHSADRMKPLVAGSVGSFGAMLLDGSEYTGTFADNMTEKELMDWHRPRMKVLVESGVDVLALETIPCANEAAALVKLLKEFPSMKAWLSFSCRDKGLSCKHQSDDSSRDSLTKSSGITCRGELLSEAVHPAISSDQILAVGVNCTHPDAVTDCLLELQEANKKKKLLVYANSGEPWDDKLKWYGKEKMVPLTSYLEKWYNLGARWIGGCCRINPSDISDIRTKLDDLTSH
ncbi:homocysteine S-methyltransferase YbgG-like [Tubulanus polymorphus]|uniref:homocysteine S-methyltransferase YbgG-like n=1 Tax=Tubulanus polymorphus TaxID=672921 RepID=UPI003DA3AD2A